MIIQYSRPKRGVITFAQRETAALVVGSKVDLKIMPDDHEEIRVQKYLKLESGQELLIANDIDLAARGTTLKAGDNQEGGTTERDMHWMHHRPSARHPCDSSEHKRELYRKSQPLFDRGNDFRRHQLIQLDFCCC